jgi:hypothetical protein
MLSSMAINLFLAVSDGRTISANTVAYALLRVVVRVIA